MVTKLPAWGLPTPLVSQAWWLLSLLGPAVLGREPLRNTRVLTANGSVPVLAVARAGTGALCCSLRPGTTFLQPPECCEGQL